MHFKRILVVHRRSAYTDLVADKKESNVSRLIKTGDPLVEGIVTAHKHHSESLPTVKKVLESRELKATWLHRIGNINLDQYDLIIALGGDGTVLHASHSIGNTPVLAVNSSPSTSVGFFTGANADNFGTVLDQVLSEQLKPVTLSRMEVAVNGKVVTSRALNDVLFCHDCPASTTRYQLTFDDHTEDQISSGVWVSTAAGSTAVIRSAGGKMMPPRSKQLQFAVREPFPLGGKEQRIAPSMVRGFVPEDKSLNIRSKTEAASLYIDGPHVVFPVDFGDVVTFARSNTSLHLFGYNKKYSNFP
jgi:NAD+ kinase